MSEKCPECRGTLISGTRPKVEVVAVETVVVGLYGAGTVGPTEFEHVYTTVRVLYCATGCGYSREVGPA